MTQILYKIYLVEDAKSMIDVNEATLIYAFVENNFINIYHDNGIRTMSAYIFFENADILCRLNLMRKSVIPITNDIYFVVLRQYFYLQFLR